MLKPKIKRNTLQNVEELGYHGIKFFGIMTSSIRLLPDFIIIGAQRCGTSSLYKYLVKHPLVASSLRKEIHYFDNNYKKGLRWYRAHFPSILYKNFYKQIRKQEIITGEASPYYLFHPHAPKRIFDILPRNKLIILLRNPVDRAYSHYNHEINLGVETLSFKEAIEIEEKRLSGEVEKILSDENYYSFNHNHYSYLSRGIYVDQIKKWINLFPKNQILIIKSENFYNETQKIYSKVLEFLELPNWKLEKYEKYNIGSYQKMNATMKKRLTDLFAQHNQRLYEYLKKENLIDQSFSNNGSFFLEDE